MKSKLKPGITAKSNPRAYGIILSAVGIFFIVVGFIQYNQAKIPASYLRTNGTITQEVSKVNSTRAGTMTDYYPVIKFQAKNGASYAFTGRIGYTDPDSYIAGNSIAIAYNPLHPGSSPKLATPDARRTQDMTIYVYSGAGVLVSLIGLGALLYTTLRKSRQ
jgi:hypothetical protein